MHKGPAAALAVVAFLIATVTLVYLGRGPVPAAAESGAGSALSAATSTAGGAVSGTGAAQKSAVPVMSRAASNVTMTKLKSGEKPPQFIIFSLDGAGSHDIWKEFLAAAATSRARFTAFLTGTYLLDDAHASAYTGPGHKPGVSAVGFGGDKSDLATEVADLNAAWAAGHEIGTHYNGHFCSGNAPSGNDWSVADWDSELGQFMKFVDTFRSINGYTDVPALAFSSADIRGGRIPCLEGDLAAVTPVWKKYGMTYDSSKNRFTGIGWPEAIDGIWEFQMPYAYSPAFDRKVIGMNYNMWTAFNGAKDDPSSAPQLRAQVKRTYDYQFAQVYAGNRAPLVIETHASTWNGNSFVPPALDFMKEVCVKANVICATYSDVVTWMQAQDPKVLQALQSQPVVATGP
ncbi:MAG: polysaccharide deacetylase [Nakamurella sp.]